LSKKGKNNDRDESGRPGEGLKKKKKAPWFRGKAKRCEFGIQSKNARRGSKVGKRNAPSFKGVRQDPVGDKGALVSRGI